MGKLLTPTLTSSPATSTKKIPNPRPTTKAKLINIYDFRNLFFNKMIWDLIEETGFNQHFSNPDTTITTLLLDENIITELKNLNPQLLD
jgi:hypothetical protein